MTLQLPTLSRRLRRLLAVLLVLAAYVGATVFLARRYDRLPDRRAPRCEVRGGWLYRGGDKFLVKGVGWDPARPGELPWTRKRSLKSVPSDFRRIREAGFNTIRTWDALSGDELAAAESAGLAVIQGIWIDPDGMFSNPEFRRKAIEKVSEIVRASRSSSAVIAYIIMNEPRPARVLYEGVEATRALLRDLAEAVRSLDPGTPVAFANWPGDEFLDEPSLDFVAANLYPFRPGALLDAVGYEGMIALWKRRIAGERPLLVTEFGISVAPEKPKPDSPGGASEEEQARELPRLADAILRGAGAGSLVFMWNDGWWKNGDHPGDELKHEPDDGEEWFGLVAMDKIDDDAGRSRPALEAMRAFNRAVLTLPASGPASAREVEVEAHVEEEGDFTIEAAINGGEPALVPCVRDGPWLRGRMGLLSQAHGPQRIDFVISGRKGPMARFNRIVMPPGEGPALALQADGTGARRRVVASARDGAGRPLAGAEVRIAITEANRRSNRLERLRTNEAGEVAVEVDLPPAPAVLLVAAGLRSESDGPPLALDWTILRVETSK